MFEVREKIDPRSLAGALERLRTGGRELPDSKPVAIAHGTLCVLLACLEIGRKADPSKLFEEAVPALERAAKLDDRAAEPRLALGILNTIRGSLLKLEGKDDGSVGRAKAALTAALERAPESADAWRWLGYARYVAAEYAGALEAWDRALRLNAEFEAELKPYLEEAKRRRG
jgi:tetratricopeptide (TPR) repeat protein